MILAHVAGIPVEETLAMLAPVMGVALAGVGALLHSRRTSRSAPVGRLTTGRGAAPICSLVAPRPGRPRSSARLI